MLSRKNILEDVWCSQYLDYFNMASIKNVIWIMLEFLSKFRTILIPIKDWAWWSNLKNIW